MFLPHDDVLGGHIRRYVFEINKKTKLHSDGLILKIKRYFSLLFFRLLGQAEMLGQQLLPPHSCLIVFLYFLFLKIFLNPPMVFFVLFLPKKKKEKEMLSSIGAAGRHMPPHIQFSLLSINFSSKAIVRLDRKYKSEPNRRVVIVMTLRARVCVCVCAVCTSRL